MGPMTLMPGDNTPGPLEVVVGDSGHGGSTTLTKRHNIMMLAQFRQRWSMTCQEFSLHSNCFTVDQLEIGPTDLLELA